MALADLSSWLAAYTGDNFVWYVKRLAANDTLASGAHQAGPYIPKDFLFGVFPRLDRPDAENPDFRFTVRIDPEGDQRVVRAVWYNNRLRGGTRNETRLTNFGGQVSPVLNADSTGALTVFVFGLGADRSDPACRIWVCRDPAEEGLVEDLTGPVEPGAGFGHAPGRGVQPGLAFRTAKAPGTCRLAPEQIPGAWLGSFPTGAEIIQKAVEMRPLSGAPPDQRLTSRRECEYEIFLSVEEAIEMPVISRGFASIEEFVLRAQSILQRRKARSGRSLELHAREIMIEEGLEEDRQFSHGAESETGRRPDFLFPSQDRYRDPEFPDDRLRMLAVKTTCRDRWRQVLNEAQRIPVKHLLTLQQGVSVGQFQEMKESGVRLVVPQALVKSFPKEVRPELVTFGTFIREVARLAGA